jgi:two-component system sensor kinase FixL
MAILSKKRGDAELAAQWAAVQATSSDAVLILDNSGVVRHTNSAGPRILGVSEEGLVGKRVDEILPEVAAVLRGGASAGPVAKGMEIEALRSTGEPFPARVSVSEFAVEDERGFVAVVHDVSRLRSAEAGLRQREELLKLTIEHAPTGIATVDLEGRFLSVNRTLCLMVGYEPGELVGHPVNAITHPDDIESSDALLENLRCGALDEHTTRKRYITNTGTVLEGRLSACLVRDARGAPMMYVGQFEDLTDRLRAEREAEEGRQRLAQMTRLSALGEMAAGIAHEMNQPLAAISNYARAVGRMIRSNRGDRGELLEALDRIAAQAERAGEVIQHLRDLVRRRSSTRVALDIRRVLREALELADDDAKQHGIAVRLHEAEDLPMVMADPVQVQGVALNLLHNAIDAMEGPESKPRTIEVHVDKNEDGDLLVSVRDHGVGIPAEAESRLFVPFNTTKERGLGLGLSISRSIVESHGGRLWFSRNEVRGATFHLTLPRVTESGGYGDS